MNKRGQVLVFFVILIPVLVATAAFAIDMSFNLYKTNQLRNLNRMVVKYGVNHLQDNDLRDKMIDLIYQNDKDIDSYNLVIKNGVITLHLNKTIDSIFGKAINIKFYYLSSKYVGYIKDGKKVIEKG